MVIVRSDAARCALPDALGSGLVLTVEEAKGLEFDDVCVYDFFSGMHTRMTLTYVADGSYS